MYSCALNSVPGSPGCAVWLFTALGSQPIKPICVLSTWTHVQNHFRIAPMHPRYWLINLGGQCRQLSAHRAGLVVCVITSLPKMFCGKRQEVNTFLFLMAAAGEAETFSLHGSGGPDPAGFLATFLPCSYSPLQKSQQKWCDSWACGTPTLSFAFLLLLLLLLLPSALILVLHYLALSSGLKHDTTTVKSASPPRFPMWQVFTHSLLPEKPSPPVHDQPCSSKSSALTLEALTVCNPLGNRGSCSNCCAS